MSISSALGWHYETEERVKEAKAATSCLHVAANEIPLQLSHRRKIIPAIRDEWYSLPSERVHR
jgi:hypothetical protein